MTIDINQYQSISINRLISIIDDQSMAKIRVVIDWYRFPITIDRLIDIDWLQISSRFKIYKLTGELRHINIASLYALVNTFYFKALNVDRRTILSSYCYYNALSACIRFPFRGSTSSDCRWASCPRWVKTLNMFPPSPLFLLAVNTSLTFTSKRQSDSL